MNNEFKRSIGQCLGRFQTLIDRIKEMIYLFLKFYNESNLMKENSRAWAPSSASKRVALVKGTLLLPIPLGTLFHVYFSDILLAEKV